MNIIEDTKGSKPPRGVSNNAPATANGLDEGPPQHERRGARARPANASEPSKASELSKASERVFRALLVDLIAESAFNVHRDPDADLIASVKERGVLEPILVRMTPTMVVTERDGTQRHTNYEIVFGERRWKAARANGHRTIMAEVRELTDEQALDLQTEENLHRTDLTPLEEAQVFSLHARHGLDATAIAARVHKSERFVAQRLKLLELRDDAREALRGGRILLGTALELACLPSSLGVEQHVQALKLCLSPDGVLSVREARAKLTARFYLRMIDARFDVTDASLVPSAGACTSCPKRTSTQLALSLEGLDQDDRCGDPMCWTAKSEAAWARRAEDARAKGARVIDTTASNADAKAARKVLWGGKHIDLDAECDIVVRPEIETRARALEEERAELVAYKDESSLAPSEKARLTEIDRQLLDLDAKPAPTWREVLTTIAEHVKEAPPPAPTCMVRETLASPTARVHEMLDAPSAYKALLAGREVLEREGLAINPEDLDDVKAGAQASEPDEKDESPAKRDVEMRDERKLAERTNEIYRARLRRALVDYAERSSPRPPMRFWRALIAAVLHTIGFEQAFLLESMFRARGWAFDEEWGDDDVVEAVRAKDAHLTEGQLRGLLVDVLANDLSIAELMAETLSIGTGEFKAAAARDARAEAKKGVANASSKTADVKMGAPKRVVELDEPKPAAKRTSKKASRAVAEASS